VASPKSSNAARDIADRAVALASGDGDSDRAGAPAALIKLAGDETGPLELARQLLVRRIRTRSDDFPATSGLSLINIALSQLGPRDDLEWQPRVWRIPH
jgi:hypothetical protein